MKIRKPKPILRTQPAELRCYWRNCRAEFDDIESLIKHVHDEVAKSEAQCALSKQWHCHWNDCSRLKCFDVKYQLLAHMRIHTKERPFACTIDDCTCTFRRRENLMTHIRTHSGERPYTCQFPNCEKAFTNASDRAKHQTRTHSEGKPFVCRVVDCPKAYTDPSSLRKHVNGIHGEEVYNLMRKIKDIEDANDGEVHYIYISSDPGLGETRIVTYTEARALSDPVKVDVKRCEVEKFIDRQIALARIINAEKAKARVAKQRVIKHETIRILPPPSQVILVPYVKQETNPMQHSPFQNENNHDPMLVSLNQDDDNLIKYQELLSESTNSCFNATSSSSSRKRSMTNRDDVPSYFDLGEDDFSATRDWDATPGAMNEDYTMIHSVRRSAYDGINDIWDVDIDAPASSGFPVDPDTPSMFKPDYPSSSVNTNSIYDDFFDKNGLGLSSPDKRYTMVLGDQNEDVFSRAFA